MSIYELDVFAVTDKGNGELKGGSTRLATEALELLVLLDGKTSIADVAGKIPGGSLAAIMKTAQVLVDEGYIKPATAEQELNMDFSYFFNDQPAEPPAEATEKARGEADNGAALSHLAVQAVSPVLHA